MAFTALNDFTSSTLHCCERGRDSFSSVVVGKQPPRATPLGREGGGARRVPRPTDVRSGGFRWHSNETVLSETLSDE